SSGARGGSCSAPARSRGACTRRFPRRGTRPREAPQRIRGRAGIAYPRRFPDTGSRRTRGIPPRAVCSTREENPRRYRERAREIACRDRGRCKSRVVLAALAATGIAWCVVPLAIMPFWVVVVVGRVPHFERSERR